MNTSHKLDYLDLKTTVSKGMHGGYRSGSGRPKGSKSYKTIVQEKTREALSKQISEHVLEEETVTYIDKSGKLVTKTQARLISLLDVLFRMGMSGNLPAAREYLDRTIGKPGYMANTYATEKEAEEMSAFNAQKSKGYEESLTPKEALALQIALLQMELDKME